MNKSFQLILIITVFILYTVFFAEPINFVTADLGRHLVNGRLFLESFLISGTNLYSYTFRDFPFLNHHWGSGVLFYLIYISLGFKGLSLIFILLSLLTLGIFLKLSIKYSNIWVISLVSIFTLPLITDRTEIRPEGFSYLFSAIYFYILWDFSQTRANFRRLFILPVLGLLWVNIHIYFLFGIFLIWLFAVEDLLTYLLKRSRENFRRFLNLLGILMLTIGVSLFNPNFIKGLVYPMQIFSNYGYRVLENQSPFFLLRIIDYGPTYYFGVLFILFLVSWGYAFWNFYLKKTRISIVLLILSIGLSYLAFSAVRNFAIFGYLAIFIISFNFRDVIKKLNYLTNPYVYATLFFSTLLIILMIKPDQFSNRDYGIGLNPNVLVALDFYKQNNLTGPIFNNYDIGGYLIYGLYPREWVFVDNRPEAYPAEFFKKVYIPMQENEEVWGEQDQKYNFNTIFFYRLDATPWSQKFLVNRIKDPNWAPVFVNDYVIIFVKRNEENQDIIKKFELPKNMFKT